MTAEAAGLGEPSGLGEPPGLGEPARTGGSAGSWQPLRGLNVLDFSLLLPGPFGTLALADLGAEVVHVEPPGGDGVRHLPGALFRTANRNKRSIVLDLKAPASRPVVERLATWADVSVEGFRPGVAARLRIDHASLSAINPRLVSCSVSGYGRTGPDNGAPGHDLNYLAASGAFALAGHWSEPPRRSGLPVADLAAGSYAAIAILAALRERDRTGRGVDLDIAMSEAALSFTAVRHGLELDRTTRDHLWPTNDLFETADGRLLALGIVEEKFWTNFVAAARDLAPDLESSDYADEASRRERGDALATRMREVMRMRDRDSWTALFRRHDVPASVVLTPAEAARDPQVVAREVVQCLGGERHVPFPVFADGQRGAALRTLAEPAGASGPAILRELGFGADEIAAMREAGALGRAAAEGES